MAKVFTALLGALVLATPAYAQPGANTTGDSDVADGPRILFQADTRLRYEFAETQDQPDAGEALTLRIRPSVEITPVPEISIIAEAEGIVSLLPDRLNGFVTGLQRPGVADQETLELNRLQVEFAPSELVSFAVGRQRISIDDERFIGIVDFRQNQQTYDAVTASIKTPDGIQLRGGYIWRVGRVLGLEQPDGVFESDSFFLNASAPVPLGQVSAFYYNLDLDDRSGMLIRSQTSGVAYRGRVFRGALGLFWEASYARQNSDGGSPEYARAAISADYRDISLALTFEELGSDGGIAFQTPLATLHRFQGAADLFLVTPPEGIEDIQARATWRIGSLGSARATSLAIQYNRFDAATGGADYGEEWGARFATTFISTRFSAEVAHYRAREFASDTTRFWLTASRKF